MMNDTVLGGATQVTAVKTYLSTHDGKVLIRRVSESEEMSACSRLVLLERHQYNGGSLRRGDLGQSM